MSAWRTARQDDLNRLWPAVRSARVMSDASELEAFWRAGPWRVRLTEKGDALILATWRAHLPVLAIRGAWAPPHRMPELVTDAIDVAAAQGFETLLSPLLPESMQGPYLDSGMRVLEPLVVLQGLSQRVATRYDLPVRLRRAHKQDAEKLASTDALCFDEFWRHTTSEWDGAVSRERVMLLEGEEGLLGYASASIHGSVCTLGRLGVVPQARRRGLGSMLVSDVLHWAGCEGVPVVSLCTQAKNEASRALYRSLGLVELEEAYGLLARDVGSPALSDTL